MPALQEPRHCNAGSRHSIAEERQRVSHYRRSASGSVCHYVEKSSGDIDPTKANDPIKRGIL